MTKSSYDVAAAIQTAITAAYPAVTVGIVNLPVGAGLPSVVLQPLTITENDGSWAQPHEMGLVYIGITSIGGTAQQAAGIQASIRRLLLQRAGSGYTASLSVNGEEPLWREPETLGPVIPGDNVFRTDDTYSFKEMLI